MPRLPPPACLDWSSDGVPRSRAHGDVYFSRAGGLAESEAVFLAGCGLPDKWTGCKRFTILELGFGAGLNALAVWRAWKSTRAHDSILHFVSVESTPMDVHDAARAHAAFPEIEALASRLRARWPVRAFGAQRAWFAEDGFALTIIHADALEAVRGFAGRAEAVFLDGFAPDRNAGMWSSELMRAVAARCAPGARIATYSVAGHVRRALADAGFDVEKRPGFASKRERLEGALVRQPDTERSMFPQSPSGGRVAIVGAGVAGAALADALRRRGRDCVIVERKHIAAGASFNAGALVMPRLDRGASPIARLHVEAYIAAQLFYEARDAIHRCGVVQFTPNAAGLLADPPLPDDWLAPAGEGALLHRRAGIVDPRSLIEDDLLADAQIVGGDVHALTRDANIWRLLDAQGEEIVQAETVVLANGASIASFAQSAWLPMRLSRGQVEWKEGGALTHAIVDRSYAAPCQDGILFGATFDRTASADAEPTEESRRRNFAALRELSPQAFAQIHGEQSLSRASVRAATPDLSPLLGLMPDSDRWLRVYEDIAFGRTPPVAEPPCLSGLYAFGGLGARGFTLAPLLAENLASEICGEPQTLSRFALDAIHPARFLLRALKRRENILS